MRQVKSATESFIHFWNWRKIFEVVTLLNINIKFKVGKEFDEPGANPSEERVRAKLRED
jgi:hypothetical protein